MSKIILVFQAVFDFVSETRPVYCSWPFSECVVPENIHTPVSTTADFSVYDPQALWKFWLSLMFVISFKKFWLLGTLIPQNFQWSDFPCSGYQCFLELNFQKQVADPDHFVRWMLGATKCSGLACGGSESSVLWSLSFVKKMVRGGVGGTGDPQTLL